MFGAEDGGLNGRVVGTELKKVEGTKKNHEKDCQELVKLVSRASG